MKNYDFYVYIMSSYLKTLYVGVTNDLTRRVAEHKSGKTKGFTSKYKINRLVYSEHFDYIEDAIKREKQIKHWRRSKKIYLIEQYNLEWRDLSEDWEL